MQKTFFNISENKCLIFVSILTIKKSQSLLTLIIIIIVIINNNSNSNNKNYLINIYIS